MMFVSPENVSGKPDHYFCSVPLNLVLRAFPLINGWGGKRPWHRLVICHLYRSIKEVLQILPLAVPFIEIGGKQKITKASICDKKETL